jgi:hypothetical protein
MAGIILIAFKLQQTLIRLTQQKMQRSMGLSTTTSIKIWKAERPLLF